MRDLLFAFMLTSVTVSCLIPLVSISFMLLQNRLSIRSKYFIWLGVLVSLFLPFQLPWSLGQIEVHPPVSVLPAPAVSRGGGSPSSPGPSPVSQAAGWGLNLFQVLLVIWLIGVLVTLGRQLYSYVTFRRLLKRWGDPVDDSAIWGHMDAVRGDLGIKRSIDLVFCPLVHSPLLFGFRRPTIVLPDLDYSPEEWELIFHHELVHHVHGDVYISLLAMVIKSLHWYNPLVRFATKELLEAGEMYCDATVLAQQDLRYRTFYGETILTMIDRSKKNQVALTTCFYSNRFNLKRRILAIMDNRYPWRILSVVAAVTIAGLLFVSRSLFVMAQPPTSAPVEYAGSATSQVAALTPTQAGDRALAEAGLTPDQVTELTVERQDDRYLVSFHYQEHHYDYQLDAWTGQILRMNQTTLIVVSASDSTSSSSQASSERPTSEATTPTLPASSAMTTPGAAPQLANQAAADEDEDDEDDEDDNYDDDDDQDDDDDE